MRGRETEEGDERERDHGERIKGLAVNGGKPQRRKL